MDETEKLLQELCEARGTIGREDEVGFMVSGEHGAAASAHLVDPDAAIVRECGLAEATPEQGEDAARARRPKP